MASSVCSAGGFWEPCKIICRLSTEFPTRNIASATGCLGERDLVSRTVSKKHSASLINRIKNGTFKPKPDNKAAVKKILEGNRRPDQPYITGIKAENSKALSKQNVKYSHKDFEKVLSVMRKQKITLNEACKKYDLPGKGTILRYAELNPEFRKKLLDTYHGLPYEVQARADMFSPQFYRDLERLKKKGLPATEIGKALGISSQNGSEAS